MAAAGVLALPAPPAHARMQLLAPLLQPVGSFQLQNLLAEPARLSRPVYAEVPIGLDFVPEFAADHLDHDRVIQEAEPGDVVRDQVFGVGEIGKRLQHPVAVFLKTR